MQPHATNAGCPFAAAAAAATTGRPADPTAAPSVPMPPPASGPITLGDLREFPADPAACMMRLHKLHGPLAQLRAEDGMSLTFVFSPELNRTVLSDGKRFHSKFFAIRGNRRSAQRRVTSGLLTMNGADHKRHRRMVMEPFSKRIMPAYHEAIAELTAELLNDWQVGGSIDLHEEMNGYMRKLTSAILFGLDDPELAYRTGEKIDRWVHLNHNTGMGALVSDSEYLDSYDELLDLAEDLEGEVQAMIDARRGKPPGRDVLSILIDAAEKDPEGGGITDTELIGHVTLLFGAAHLTTAHSMTWTLFLLAQHPEIAQALAAEVAAGVAGDAATPGEADALPLLDRVIKESMRCLPASGYSQRLTAETVELGPLKLSPGSAVIFSQYITHHLPEIYPDPMRFTPERWEDLKPPSYGYIPFGSGPRLCLGAMLATTVLKTVIPSVLKRYRLSCVPGSTVDAKIVSTMLGPTTPVPMEVHPADGRWQHRPVHGNVNSLVDLDHTHVQALRKAA
ncbi:cytochrome P450 [Alienimonas sp. DA493]|uniref:cytochrome P450 n=1 Tax=Alienimonas sp. DA493 TaxID=3373605 RepID=UPI003754471A